MPRAAPRLTAPPTAGAASKSPALLLRRMFDAAVTAGLPAGIVARYLPERPKGRTIVLGAGKASAAMAKAVEDAWEGALGGLVVTRYGHGVPCERIQHKKDVEGAIKRMLASKETYVLDIMTPYTEHVLPMIPSGMTYKDIITE